MVFYSSFVCVSSFVREFLLTPVSFMLESSDAPVCRSNI